MKKILIVEDDRFLLNAYKYKLERSGFEVITALDGEEALKVLKNDLPDLIILDLIMPNKDGFEVLEEIKKDLNLKKIPVIVCSNLGQPEDIKKAKELGASDYFIKSDLSLEEIVVRINKFLASKKD